MKSITPLTTFPMACRSFAIWRPSLPPNTSLNDDPISSSTGLMPFHRVDTAAAIGASSFPSSLKSPSMSEVSASATADTAGASFPPSDSIRLLKAFLVRSTAPGRVLP